MQSNAMCDMMIVKLFICLWAPPLDFPDCGVMPVRIVNTVNRTRVTVREHHVRVGLGERSEL